MISTPQALVLFEVKIRSTQDAYWQLVKKYKPVVEKALGRKVDALVQVVRSFDPATPFPIPVTHLSVMSMEKILSSPPETLLTYSWRL
jgi:hypothetical protein